jgi:hypothetical protein
MLRSHDLWSREELDRAMAWAKAYKQGASARSLALRYRTSGRKVNDTLRRLGVSIRHQGIRRGGTSEIGRCKRCDILLTEAPEGTDALCGWCVAEKAGHLPSLNAEAEPGDRAVAGLLQAVFVSGVG